MGTTVDIRFPLRRYHATPWDAGANSAAVEWPPAPWRIFRALLSVAYSHLDDVDDAVDIFAQLGNPSAYFTAAGVVSSTRHYMPDVGHKSAVRGNTDLVIDAYIAFAGTGGGETGDPDLRIHWDSDVEPKNEKIFRLLIENLPYLGRSESLCDAEISTEDVTPDSQWWRLGEAQAAEEVDVLGIDGRVSRVALEADPTSRREKKRSLYPEGARLLCYGRTLAQSGAPDTRATAGAVDTDLTAVIFELGATVPVRIRELVALTDACHAAVRQKLNGLPSSEVAAVMGKDGTCQRRNDHDHLHVVALTADRSSASFSAKAEVTTLILWIPGAMSADVVRRIRRVRELGADRRDGPGTFPTQHTLFAGAGKIENIASAAWLCSSGRQWVSATPYLPVRHRHRNQTIEDWLREDIQREIQYRHLDVTVDSVVVRAGAEAAASLAGFRRRRPGEPRQADRKGVYVEFTLSDAVSGPLLLGQLSHFGMGLMLPRT